MSEERDTARDFIVTSCLKLVLGEETFFDADVVRMAFPAARRSSEDQLLEYLQGSRHGEFKCRRDVGTGDFIVIRLDDQ